MDDDQTLPCGGKCCVCKKGFQKLVASKLGLIVYVKQDADVNINITNQERTLGDVTGRDESKEAETKTNVVIIVQNNKDNDVTSEDHIPEIDMNEVRCPRCRYVMARAKALLKNVPVVKKNNIKCVCELCDLKRQARVPCLHCLKAITTFKLSEYVNSRKDDILKQQIQTFLKNAFRKSTIDKRRRNLRAHSDVHLADPDKRRSKHIFFLERPKSAMDSTFTFVSDKLQKNMEESKLKPKPQEVICRGKDRPYHTRDVKLKSETVIGLGTTGIMRQYHSEESLTSFGAIKEDTIKNTFKYVFPTIMKKEQYMYQTSAQLIKDTRERFQAEIEEKNRQREERIRKLKAKQKSQQEKEKERKKAKEEIKRKIEWAKQKGINLSDINMKTGKILQVEKYAVVGKDGKFKSHEGEHGLEKRKVGFAKEKIKKGKEDKRGKKIHGGVTETDKQGLAKKGKRYIISKDQGDITQKNKGKIGEEPEEKRKEKKHRKSEEKEKRHRDVVTEKDREGLAKKGKRDIINKDQGDATQKNKGKMGKIPEEKLKEKKHIKDEEKEKRHRDVVTEKDKQELAKKGKRDIISKDQGDVSQKNKGKISEEPEKKLKEKKQRKGEEKEGEPFTDKRDKQLKEKGGQLEKRIEVKSRKDKDYKHNLKDIEKDIKGGIEKIKGEKEGKLMKDKDYKQNLKDSEKDFKNGTEKNKSGGISPKAKTSGKEEAESSEKKIHDQARGTAEKSKVVGAITKTSGAPTIPTNLQIYATGKTVGVPGKTGAKTGQTGENDGKAVKLTEVAKDEKGTEVGKDEKGTEVEKDEKGTETSQENVIDQQDDTEFPAKKSKSGDKKGELLPSGDTPVDKKKDKGATKEEIALLNKMIDKQDKALAVGHKFMKAEEEKLASIKEKAAKRTADQLLTAKSLDTKDIIGPKEMGETDTKPKDKILKKSGDVSKQQIKIQLSGDDLILKLIQMRGNKQEKTKEAPIPSLPPVPIKRKREILQDEISEESTQLDAESLLRRRMLVSKEPELVYGQEIMYIKDIPPESPETKSVPALFHADYTEDDANETIRLASETETTPKQGNGGGAFRYALSDRKFISNGWTILPTEKIVRKVNIYRMHPAQPEFDWFKYNKQKGTMRYDTGEKLAEIDENGRGRWYYKNGRLALNYYDCEESNAEQRFVIYSSGEPDERGRSTPITVLGMFDYNGNGVVFDHAGKIRLKYNQNEGVVLDRGIGPVSTWKWHSLNDPPELQQVMIDNQLPYKDPEIYAFNEDNRPPKGEDETMLEIEFNNYLNAQKNSMLKKGKFQNHQINMKAMKMNEQFSLKILDQTRIYLLFRDGGTTMKCNLGLKIAPDEIVDTGFSELGVVELSMEKQPARTYSIEDLQKSLRDAQRLNQVRVARESKMIPPEPAASADRLTSAASKPLRRPLLTEDPAQGKYRIPPNNLYYNTRII